MIMLRLNTMQEITVFGGCFTKPVSWTWFCYYHHHGKWSVGYLYHHNGCCQLFVLGNDELEINNASVTFGMFPKICNFL